MVRPPIVGQVMHLAPSSAITNQNSGPINPSSNAAGFEFSSQGDVEQQEQCMLLKVNKADFTKQQLYVLRAQILAYWRLKRGDCALPPEVLLPIIGILFLPFEAQPRQAVPRRPAVVKQETSDVDNASDQAEVVEEKNELPKQACSGKGQNLPHESSFSADEKGGMANQNAHGVAGSVEQANSETPPKPDS